jgi:hypothetical protein
LPTVRASWQTRAASIGDWGAKPYRVITVVEGQPEAGADLAEILEATAALVGRRDAYLFGYLRPGGDYFVGVFDCAEPQRARSGGYRAWPAFVRTRKRPSTVA